MTLSVDAIRGVAGVVAGWDPTAIDRASAGGIGRAYVELAETVARGQVLALVAAKKVGLLADAGAKDLSGWLRAQGVSGRDARVLGDAAWCAAGSSLVRGALEEGGVSVAHVAELREVCDLVADRRCDEAELATLLEGARHQRAEETRKAAQAVVQRIRQHEPRRVGKVYESDAEHGQKQLRSLLNPEDHDRVRRAIDRIVDEQWRSANGDDTEPTAKDLPSLRAIALVELARRSLASEKSKGGAGPEVIVIIDAETFLTGELRPDSESRLDDGTPVPPRVAQELANEAGLRCYARLPNGKTGLSERIRIEPVNLDHGRTRRLAGYEQRLALAVEHRTCITCDTPFRYTEAHHAEWWEHGDRTDLSNLKPTCTREHHLVHDKGWTLHHRPDSTYELRPPPPVTEDA